MRTTHLVATAVAAALLTAGCGTSDPGRGTAQPQKVTRSDAALSDAAQTGPSGPAQMICSDEIARAVKIDFQLSRRPARTDAWADQVYRCDYTVGDGTLHLSVKDDTDLAAGAAYFAALRAKLPGAELLSADENLGFPAFETTDGGVVFIKDGKTLRVDVSDLPDAAIPDGFTRRDMAYGIAAAVISCWTE